MAKTGAFITALPSPRLGLLLLRRPSCPASATTLPRKDTLLLPLQRRRRGQALAAPGVSARKLVVVQPTACAAANTTTTTTATSGDGGGGGSGGGDPPAAGSPRPLAPCAVRMPEPLHDGRDQKIALDGVNISFDYFAGARNRPVVFFLQGFFYGGNRRAKANALEIAARRANYSFLVADYYGTGLSEGDFAMNGTLSLWIRHAVAMIDAIVGNRPVILCGAGVGAWIMLHVAQERRRNVVGLVGVNASVDFTEDLIRPGLTAEQRLEIDANGFVDLPWGRTSYPIGRALLSDARHWLCLRGGENSIAIERPIRLLQGLNDEEVPPARVLKLVDIIDSDDLVISFVKGADHIFEDERDFQRMWNAVVEVSESWYEYDLTSPGSG